jgi:ankyrin repeat protein
MHKENMESKANAASSESGAGKDDMKSLRKQQLERELELLESQIAQKRTVIDKTEEEVERAHNAVTAAKDDEATALFHQRQAALKAQADEARRLRELAGHSSGNKGSGTNDKSRAIDPSSSNSSSSSGGGDGEASAEREAFERERNEMLEKMEMLEMQNKLLASRVERTETRAQELLGEEQRKREAMEEAERAAQEALLLERAEKTLAISQLEGQQQSLLESEKAEKEELERERAKLRAKLAMIEASEASAQETLLADKAEREELKRNLANMEASHQEAHLALEMERQERLEAIAKMEEEKKVLMQEQELRHRAIAMEKEELRVAMKAMEGEKKALFDKVSASEEKAQEEIQQLEMHKVEYELSIRRLEEEKQALDSKMRSVEQQSEMVTEALADQLSKEKAQLQQDMKKLEDEKSDLASSLEESTQKSLKAQEEMNQRLEQERSELRSNLAKMEEEKKALASHLEQSMKESKEQSRAIQDKAREEHAQLQAAIALAEAEKTEIARKLEENTHQLAAEGSGDQQGKGDEQTKEAQEEHARAMKQLEVEREALKASMEEMAREKTEMQRQLQATEDEAKREREKETQRYMREKDELKAAVQKMKEELQREKEAAKKAADEAAKVAAEKAAAEAAAAGSSPDKEPHVEEEPEEAAVKTLKPSKSLYDMFQEEGPEDASGPQLPRTLSKALLADPTALTIDVIQEGDETQEDNIFGVDDSDDWGDTVSMGSKASKASRASRGSKSSKRGAAGKKKVEKTPDPFDDLPAPHAAAAGGDIARLKMLGRLEVSLLSSFDAAHRCPLFYAVAYGQVEVTQFLVDACPEMVLAVDAHGDTPLHAAASGGSHECMEALLDASAKYAKKTKKESGQGHGDSGNSLGSGPASFHDSSKYGDIANPRNAMQMTPSHLARSPDVVEVLYNYGADLSAQDSNGRSPLFVACAMNREPCADFIINSLDREGKTDEIYEKDRRGDTALHAAACNGSVDCLLLLLQYGIDPTVGNIKNLKAIDLAARNGHVRCRDVLAEYHLHFCTSSEFDSVLFLATLQGHKRVKEEHGKDSSKMPDGMPPSAANDEGSYNIIKKKSSFSLNNGSASGGAGGTGAVPKGLKHVQSMFSLKTQKSLRVQRWGEWIAYEDQQTNHIYWYNHAKGEGQWEKPEEVAKLQLDAALGASPGGGEASDVLSPAHTLSPKKSMRLKRHGDWIEYVTETAQTFFYNEKNGEFQWTAPPGVVPRSATKGEVTPVKGGDADGPGPDKSTPEHALLGNQASSGAHTPQAVPRKDGDGPVHTDWQPYKDPDTGNVFWYNTVTAVSQWDCPFDNMELVGGGDSADAPDSSNANGGAAANDDGSDDEAVEVVGDDDLGI